MFVNLFNTLPWQVPHIIACIVSLLSWLWIVMTWKWRPVLWVITLSLALGLLWTVFYLVILLAYFRLYCHIWSDKWYAEREARFQPPAPAVLTPAHVPFAGQFQRPVDSTLPYKVVECAECGQTYCLTHTTTGCYNCGSNSYYERG